MKPLNHEQPSIVATLVPEEERLDFLPRHFGKHMLTVETYSTRSSPNCVRRTQEVTGTSMN
ncbi:MAG: hypothetical protein KF682_12810 [Nitrospira sp.]|nr:hypothetical protein [Nitrospira sp.]